MAQQRLSPAAKRFLVREIRSRPFALAGMLGMSFVAAIIEMTGIGLIFPLMLMVADPSSIARFPFMTDVASEIGLGSKQGIYGFLLGLIAIIMVSKALYMGFFHFLQMRFLARWKVRLSNRLMRIYLFSDFRIHMEKTTAEIIRNISMTSSLVEHFLMASMNIAVSVSTIGALLAVLLATLPLETLIGALALVVAVVGIYLYTRRTFITLGQQQNEIFKHRQRLLQQSIGAIRETKILGKEHFFTDKFTEVERAYFDKQRHYNFLSILPPLILEAVVIVSILGLVSYILFQTERHPQAVAILGVLAAAMFRLMPHFNRILSGLQMVGIGRSALEIVAAEIDRYEAELNVPEELTARLRLREAIILRNVSYAYPDADAPSLRDINLTIRANEFVGITGPSGAGKSTLLGVILGLLKPTEGEVLIDGQPPTDADRLRAWQANIGFVPQGIFLFEESIARNIAFGIPDERIDRQRVEELIDLVRLRALVASSPNGIDESVGENGARLSGGERQRLGIARALYRDPDCLAFDEATSALDVVVERAITDNIYRLRGSKTMVAIAHRLSTLRECDRIVMMECGSILDAAPFDVLVTRCPQFAKLVSLSNVRKSDDVPVREAS